MTWLTVPITASSVPAACEDVRRAYAAGADAVELRLDYLDHVDDAGLTELLAAVTGRVIITCRSREEGGHFTGDTVERVSLLIAAAQKRNREHPAYVDFEYVDWRRSANVRQKVRLAAREGCGLLLSAHDFKGRPAKLTNLALDVAKEEDCVVKIAWKPRHINDNFEAFDLIRGIDRPIIALCMDEAGLLSRVLARKFGALATYASVATGKESAPGQVTIEQMKRFYRWDAMDEHTLVYGVIGNPVVHSMSPAIHNAAFERLGINAVYVPLLIEPTYEHFEAFLRAAGERPWFGLRGCSVTIPHKANALKYVRQQGGRVEPLAARIGAVNTLVIGADGGIEGSNTDYAAALDALAEGMGCQRSDLAGVAVDVLGAGGAGRAIVAGLCDCKARVTIYNRTGSKAAALAEEFGATALPWERRVRTKGDVLINCTSIGMWPDTDKTPMPAPGLSSDMVVFDTVYNPIETRLLREARELGCRTIDGVAMFVNQASAQFERWTSRPAPREVMRDVVVSHLQAV